MKKLLFSAAAAGVLAALTGCDAHISTSGRWSDADLKAATNVVQVGAIPARLKALEVDNRHGNIHITGTDQGTTAWTWKLAVRARSISVAQQIASGASCKAELEGDHLNLVVSLPEAMEPHSVQSDFEITLPKSADVRVEDHFGAVEISDLAGNVEATNENGRLDIRNIGWSVRALTSFDKLHVSNTGPAALKNQNGEIRAAGIGGPLQANTSFDLLIARDVRGPATLANQNGSIKAGGIGGLLDARTSFDSLLAKDIGGAATLRNQNGLIEVSGVGGPLDARTSFDALVARDIGGPVHLRDQNGRVKVVQARGDADIETSFDSLTAEEIQGDAILLNQNGGVKAAGITGSVKATTCFAAIDVTGAGSKFVCHNQNGAIRLRATSAALTNLEAKTSFDTLEVFLPGSLKPAIQAHTTFGDVESDFPVLMNPRASEPFGDVAPGTARITLQNQNGKIGVLRD